MARELSLFVQDLLDRDDGRHVAALQQLLVGVVLCCSLVHRTEMTNKSSTVYGRRWGFFFLLH